MTPGPWAGKAEAERHQASKAWRLATTVHDREQSAAFAAAARVQEWRALMWELADDELRCCRSTLSGRDSAGPRITPTNRMVAQFTWAAVGGPIYLFRSSGRGVYLYHYR